MLGPGDVEPDEIAGVVDDAHLVDLGVVDPVADLRDVGEGHRRPLEVVDVRATSVTPVAARVEHYLCRVLGPHSGRRRRRAPGRDPARGRGDASSPSSRRCPIAGTACSSTATCSTSGSATGSVMPRHGFRVAAALRLAESGADRSWWAATTTAGATTSGSATRVRFDPRAHASGRHAAASRPSTATA